MALSRPAHPSAGARQKEPWAWPDVPNKDAWDHARSQMSKYAPAIQQLQEVCDAYDNSGSEKIASVRNKLKEILKHTKLAMECTINPEVACPHPLNRPFEKNRMVDVASQVVNHELEDGRKVTGQRAQAQDRPHSHRE